MPDKKNISDDTTTEPVSLPPMLTNALIVFALLLPLLYLALHYGMPQTTVPPTTTAQAAPPSAIDNEVNLSLSLIQQKNYATASTVLQDVLSKQPNNGTALNNMCVVLMMQNEVAKAVPVCKQAVAAAPDMQLARNNLKWALDEQAKLPK